MTIIKQEEEWFEYRLLNDPEFLKRIRTARKDIKAGRGVPIEALKKRAERKSRSDR